jgi:hypothetical protein
MRDRRGPIFLFHSSIIVGIFADNHFKTTELTRLQIGEGSGPASIIVSTILEAENITPLLLELKQAGRDVNVSLIFQ